MLAHKLYETQGEVEIDDSEKEIISRVAEQLLTPAAGEGVMKQIKTE